MSVTTVRARAVPFGGIGHGQTGRLRQFLARELVDLALAPLRGAGVQQGAAHIAVERAAVLNPLPRDIRLRERGLQQILGIAGVGGE